MKVIKLAYLWYWNQYGGSFLCRSCLCIIYIYIYIFFPFAFPIKESSNLCMTLWCFLQFLFKKYLDYEKSQGEESRIEYVKKKAMEFVSSKLGWEPFWLMMNQWIDNKLDWETQLVKLDCQFAYLALYHKTFL